jgi:hypothetical protein
MLRRRKRTHRRAPRAIRQSMARDRDVSLPRIAKLISENASPFPELIQTYLLSLSSSFFDQSAILRSTASRLFTVVRLESLSRRLAPPRDRSSRLEGEPTHVRHGLSVVHGQKNRRGPCRRLAACLISTQALRCAPGHVARKRQTRCIAALGNGTTSPVAPHLRRLRHHAPRPKPSLGDQCHVRLGRQAFRSGARQADPGIRKVVEKERQQAYSSFFIGLTTCFSASSDLPAIGLQSSSIQPITPEAYRGGTMRRMR